MQNRLRTCFRRYLRTENWWEHDCLNLVTISLRLYSQMRSRASKKGRKFTVASKLTFRRKFKRGLICKVWMCKTLQFPTWACVYDTRTCRKLYTTSLNGKVVINAWSYTSSPQYAWMVWCSVKAQMNREMEWNQNARPCSNTLSADLRTNFFG